MITIDGPVAVGKSTVGSSLAKRLGYKFVDSGVMYRALTGKAIELGIDLQDEEALVRLAAETVIEVAWTPEGESVLVDGRDVSDRMRSPEVERGVSLVAKVAGVRKVMVAQQRRLAQAGRLIMAGRDIGTVVLPRAELKVFLSASAEERARRRYWELRQRGEEASYESILCELRRRDQIDSQRSVSPLKPAADAQIINTEGFTLEQVVDKVYALTTGEG